TEPMTEQAASTPMIQDTKSRHRRTGTVAVWISSVAVLLSVLLVVPYMAQRFAVFLLLLALGAAAGHAGIIRGLRGRRPGPPHRGWALVCSFTALLITGVMTVAFIIGMISTTSINRVELRGQGESGSVASFSNDMEQRTEEWPMEGWAKFNTKGSWAELTLE